MFDDVGHPALVLGVVLFMGFQLGQPMLPPGRSNNFGSNWDQCYCHSGHPGQPMPPPESRVG